MKAVEFIQDHVDGNILLDHYGFKHQSESDGMIRAACAIHGGNNPTAFVWNKQNNLWFCYTGDCHGGDIFTLIEKMEGVKFSRAVERAAEILGLDITNMELSTRRDLMLSDTKKWLESMNKFNKKTSVVKAEEVYELPFTKFYDDDTFTRFKKETLEHFGAKFCKVYPSSVGLLYNKLMIPIKQDEKIFGVALRDTTGNHHPKWMYDPKDWKIGKILYNWDEARKYPSVILVEGIFDVWSYHEIGIKNVVAIFGSSLKTPQANLLLQSGVEWILSFDSDETGFKCRDKTLEAFKLKADIKLITLPEGKDPGDCTKEELMNAYLNRK